MKDSTPPSPLPEDLRNHFPLLRDSELIYLDSGATTQKPREVIDRITSYYSGENANVHRALYPLGEEATTTYEKVRSQAQAFLNAKDSCEIIFTGGTTDSLNLLAHSFTQNLQEGDRILLSMMEHHSNLVPWQLAAQTRGLELDFIPVTSQGTLDLTSLDELLTSRTKLVSLTHLSNLLGTVNPVKEVIAKAHSKGIPVALDAAQSGARIPLDVQELDCDFLALSGHKIYGPTGIGLLYGKRDFLEKMPPYRGGGDMISSVQLKSSTWNELPWKFEAGTPNIAGVIGLGAALSWMEEIGRKNLMIHEMELTAYALKKLRSLDILDIYGPGDENQLGAVSFNLRGIHGHDTVQFLSARNLALRAGHHCAQPLIRLLKVPSTVRASFGAYNRLEDIDHLAQVLMETHNFFKDRGVI